MNIEDYGLIEIPIDLNEDVNTDPIPEITAEDTERRLRVTLKNGVNTVISDLSTLVSARYKVSYGTIEKDFTAVDLAKSVFEMKMPPLPAGRCEVEIVINRLGGVLVTRTFALLVNSTLASRAVAAIGKTQLTMLDIMTVSKEAYTAEPIRIANEANRELQEESRKTTFNANEVVRQTTFDTNEASRASTFTASQTAMDAEFSTAQTTRDTAFNQAQTSRDGAFTASQTAKQTAYDTAEASRNSAYSGAETTRNNSYNLAETARDASYSSAETARGASYTTSEAAREGKYNTAETARDGKYTTAETARDTLYGTAETARDTSYSASEVGRNTSYNNAETARDASYANSESTRNTTFNQAESARASAEIARSVYEDYDPLKAYVKDNKVIYRGSSFLAIQNVPAGTDVHNEIYWKCISRGMGIELLTQAEYQALVVAGEVDPYTLYYIID